MRRASLVLLGALVTGGCAPRVQVQETQMERLRREAEQDLARLEAELDSLRVQRRSIDGRIVALADRPAPPVAAAAPVPAAQAPPVVAAADAAVTTPEPGGGERALDPAEMRILEQRVYFAFDRAELGEAARQAVRQQADVLRTHPELSVRLVGHADRRGSDSYNQRLSERRASSMRRALIELGVEPNRIHIEGRSFHEPAVEGTDAEAYRQNRRVELVIE